MLWPTTNTNKPQTRLGIRWLRSRVVCWLLKQALAVVDENEVATSSGRVRRRYEARRMSSAAAAACIARSDRGQLNSSNAAHRRPCAIRLAVRLVRGIAPKSAKIFTASDVTSQFEALPSWPVPDHARRGFSSGPLAVRRSRERATKPLHFQLSFSV